VEALRQIDEWPAANAAAAVVSANGVVATHGPQQLELGWASVTKPVTAIAVLVAAEEAVVDLDEAAGPPGSTVRHLLAHASGLPFEGTAPIARPGERRIYSNTGFELLGTKVSESAEMPFEDYLRAAVLQPLRMNGVLDGSPAGGLRGTLDDLAAVAQELLAPSLVARETLDEATSVQFPGLPGVLPEFGRFEPNDWGLGFELKNGKRPHWTGERNSSRTFGHFGGSGTFLWVDADVPLACACLTDLAFGDWAREAWPKLSDAVLAELA
jgi:CubicO group peptidase (beta-lactamase class C family)